MRSPNRLSTAALLAAIALATPALALPLRAQGGSPAEVAATNPLSLATVRSLLARGDAAAAAGRLDEARGFYDQARDLTRRLLGFYRDLSGSFRGLDARIPREMDEKSKQSLEFLVQTNMRLSALFRRQGQPEVAVPLLVEVVKVMTPTSEAGRKAYQQLLEIGFVSTPWYGGGVGGAN